MRRLTGAATFSTLASERRGPTLIAPLAAGPRGRPHRTRQGRVCAQPGRTGRRRRRGLRSRARRPRRRLDRLSSVTRWRIATPVVGSRSGDARRAGPCASSRLLQPAVTGG